MKKRAILGLTLTILLLTGCGVAKLENGEEVVASVNGQNITADTLYNEIKDKYGRNTMIDMVDKIILDAKYKEDETTNTTINSQITYYKEQLKDQYLSYLKTQLGLNSEEEFKDLLKLDYRRNLAVKEYVKETITDKEVTDYYNTEAVGDIKASHILIKPEVTDEMTDEEKATKEQEALNLAKDLIARLDKGEKFEDLAKEYSTDGSASSGGDLGYFNKGKMVDAFENAAFALEKGKYTTEPVKSEFGYHIILKTDEKAKLTLEESKDSIIDTIATAKINEGDTTLSFKALQDLREKAKLDIQDSELKKQYNSYIKEITQQ